MVASLDDILVHSENLEQHLERLVVLQQFRTVGLKLNPAKCQLCKNKAEFLGYEILEEGIGTTTKSKAAAINETPIPKNQTILMTFLRLANYNRKFVKDFAKMAWLLHELVAVLIQHR